MKTASFNFSPIAPFNNFRFLFLVLLTCLVFACQKNEEVIDDEGDVPQREGIAISGPGIFQVEGELTDLAEQFVLPDLSETTAKYQVIGSPVGEVVWQQQPAPGTPGFEEGMVVNLSAADQGGNTAQREIIFVQKTDIGEARPGILVYDFLNENETKAAAEIHLTDYADNDGFVKLAIVLTPSNGEETFDPILLDPAQITLHLYDTDLQKVNSVTYPDGIWEPSSDLQSYLTPCGAFLRFDYVPVTAPPVYIVITGGTYEQQRFSAQTEVGELIPMDAVLPPNCGELVPLQVTEDVAEPCKCVWRSTYLAKEERFKDNDPNDCWGGRSYGNAHLLMSGAKPFASGSSVDECTGGAGDVAVSGSKTETLEVWVECTPRPCPECCVPSGNCSASPSFTAYANLDPPGTAISAGRIKITGSGGCSGLSADAAGATRSSSQVDESVKFTIGLGGNSSIEVLPLSKSDGVMTGTFTDTDTKSGNECQFVLHGIGLGEAKCLADADLLNWYADAEILIHQSVTDMLVKAWCTDGSSVHTNLGNAYVAEGKEK